MLAAYALKGRIQAIGLVTLFFALGLAIPPLSILGLALVAVIGLCLGAKPGLEVAIGASLIIGIASLVLLGSATPGLAMVILWVPMLLLALVLRHSRLLGLTLEVALGLSLLVPIMSLLLVGDDWDKLLEPLGQHLQESKALSAEESQNFVKGLVRWLPALLGAGFFLQQVLALFLARGWQAKLYHPGGFRQEFHQLRVSKQLTWVASGFLIGLLLMDLSQWALGRGLLVLLAVLFLLQGLAVLHALLAKAKSGQFWLIGIYALLLFALPYMGMMLAVTGYMDAWRDFRRLDQAPASPDADL